MMAEMTPERRAAWQAEEDRKAEARRRKRRERNRASTAAAQAILPNDGVLQMRWLQAYLEHPEAGGIAAARKAGYEESSANAAARRNRNKYAPQIAKAAINKDALIAKVYEAAIGPGVHMARTEGVPDLVKTLDNIEAADAQWLITGFKEGKYGPEVQFRNPDVYMKIIADAAGLAAPKVVDVNVILAGKTEAEIEALRQSALQKALAMADDIEGEFTSDGD